MADNEELSRRFIGAVNDRNWSELRSMLGPDSVHHYNGGQAKGPEEIVGFYTSLCEGMGWKIEVHGITATDNWAAVIHTNRFNEGAFEVATAVRVADGKAQEIFTVGMPEMPA